MSYKVEDFALHTPPRSLPNMTLLASFTLATGVVRLPGFGLAIADTGATWLLKPRAPDRAYRLRFVGREAGEAILDSACDTYEQLTGIAPEDAELPAASPLARAKAAGIQK